LAPSKYQSERMITKGCQCCRPQREQALGNPVRTYGSQLDHLNLLCGIVQSVRLHFPHLACFMMDRSLPQGRRTGTQRITRQPGPSLARGTTKSTFPASYHALICAQAASYASRRASRSCHEVSVQSIERKGNLAGRGSEWCILCFSRRYKDVQRQM
jgi:hypothetical protein